MFLVGGKSLLVGRNAGGFGRGSSSLLLGEVFERETDDGPLGFGGVASALLANADLGRGLLVGTTPGERPGQADGLNFLVVERLVLLFGEPVCATISAIKIDIHDISFFP